MKQERHANMAEFSAPVNRSTTASKACFTINPSKF
jgi:hypothetical protein